MTEETPIYTDEACTVPAKGALNADGTYYYKRSWYDIGNGQAKPQSGAIQFPGHISDASGNAVFKPGTPRITYIDELRTPKDSNPTATATTVLNPLWSGSSVACHLGNNGKLVIEKPGTLAISKSLVVPEGYVPILPTTRSPLPSRLTRRRGRNSPPRSAMRTTSLWVMRSLSRLTTPARRRTRSRTARRSSSAA